MSDLWWAVSDTVTLLPSGSAPVSLMDVTQSPLGSSVVRVYRIWHHTSDQRVVVTSAAVVKFIIGRIDGGVEVGEGDSVMFRPARSESVLPEGVTGGSWRYYAATAPASESILRRYARAIDPTAFDASSNVQTWELDVPMSLVFEAGSDNGAVEPVVLRAGQAVHVRQDSGYGGSHWSQLNFEMELTVGAT